MKKKILTILTAVLISAGISGCSNKNTVEPDTAKIRDDIIEAIEFPEMVNATKDNISFMYGLDSDEFESFACSYAGSGGDADEITVIKVKEESDASDVKTALEKRIDSQKNAYEGYAPIEFEQLEKAVVKTNGRYIFLAVSEDTERRKRFST
ncbi:MAG: DUF4358 domain-containing protein, partial [Oscillospiraceae bacterium]